MTTPRAFAAATPAPSPSRPTRFRTKLLVTMMLVVSGVTVLGLFFAEHNLTAGVERGLEREFQAELAALHHAQAVRSAALAERCRALVRKPRIHAALEDNALDLLYPSAQDEMRDILQRPVEAAPGSAGPACPRVLNSSACGGRPPPLCPLTSLCLGTRVPSAR